MCDAAGGEDGEWKCGSKNPVIGDSVSCGACADGTQACVVGACEALITSHTAEETAALAAYVASLGPGPAIPGEGDYSIDGLDSQAQEAAIVRGSQLFLTNCTACHNFAGSGGAMPNGGYAPQIRGVEPKYIYEALLTGPQTMPTFSNGNLSPEEKRDIIAYLNTLDEETPIGGFTLGGLGPVAEGLVGWVVGIGVLVGFAIWIGAHTTRSTKKKVGA